MNVYIYALWQHDEVVPRYVGSTKDLAKRKASHYNHRKHKEKHIWLQTSKVHFVILDVVKCRARIDGYVEEYKWIDKYRPMYNCFEPKRITLSRVAKKPYIVTSHRSLRRKLLDSI